MFNITKDIKILDLSCNTYRDENRHRMVFHESVAINPSYGRGYKKVKSKKYKKRLTRKHRL